MKSLILSLLVALFACSGNFKSDSLSEMKTNRGHGHTIITPLPPVATTSRNDIFVCGTHASPTNYYQFSNENFNTKWGLNPGDTVFIKQGAAGENYIESIDLGLGLSNGIVLMPDPSNTVVIEIGWIGVGAQGQSWKFNGHHPTLGKGFMLTSTTHFGLSLGLVGDIEIANMWANGSLMGVQIVTTFSNTYPLNYQRVYAHDNKYQNTINEAEYLGYVNDSPIAMDLRIERDTVLNSGYDGIQTRNTDTVTIRDCYLDSVGMLAVDPHSHGILFGANSNGGTVINNTLKHITGVGIWNGGWGHFVYKCNYVQAGVMGMMTRNSYPEGDVQNTGGQWFDINNNTIVGTPAIQSYYEANGKPVYINMQNNNLSGSVDISAGISTYLQNNNSSIVTNCGTKTGVIYY